MKTIKMTPIRSILATAAVVLITSCASGYSEQAVDDSAIATKKAGNRPGRPDLSEAATKLGVSKETLMTAMRNAGGPPPDMNKVAAELGISVEELKEALPAMGRQAK